jgi:hypothetical protein
MFFFLCAIFYPVRYSLRFLSRFIFVNSLSVLLEFHDFVYTFPQSYAFFLKVVLYNLKNQIFSKTSLHVFYPVR